MTEDVWLEMRVAKRRKERARRARWQKYNRRLNYIIIGTWVFALTAGLWWPYCSDPRYMNRIEYCAEPPK